MLEPTGHDQLGNALDCGSQPLRCQFAPLDQSSFRDLAPTERRERLAGASCWQQLPLVQIHGRRLQVGSILDGRADRCGKAAQFSQDALSLGESVVKEAESAAS